MLLYPKHKRQKLPYSLQYKTPVVSIFSTYYPKGGVYIAGGFILQGIRYLITQQNEC